MPEEIAREIMKLEVRINNFLKKEKKFINGLRECLEKFRELNNELTNPERVEELMMLRLKAIKTLTKTLIMESEAEHEKSHLLESYGTLIQILEEAFQVVIKKKLEQPS